MKNHYKLLNKLFLLGAVLLFSAGQVSALGLTTGNYSATITDATGANNGTSWGDAFDDFIFAPALSASVSYKTDVSCNGGSNGSATVSASGGVLPYSYSWAPSGGTLANATGLTAGNYTCTVTGADGKFTSVQVTINQPPQLTTTTSQTNVSTYGGSDGTATVIVTGGTPSYTYAWSPSGGTGATASGLTAGSYWCAITDGNGCYIRSATAAITQPGPPPAIAPDANGIVYVTQTGSGYKSGDSWSNATNDFQGAINATGVKQVWVAAGTYQPASGQSFSMKSGVKIYGGFAGTETSFSQRNWVTNVTILKGNGNSVVNNNNNGLDTPAALDGFTITDGVANIGGGISNHGAALIVVNSIISGNSASPGGSGGGVSNGGVLTLINSIVSKNSAEEGGGIVNTGIVSIINSIISGNNSTGNGGGIYNTSIFSSAGKLTIGNSVIWGNSAGSINGIYNSGTLTVTYSDVQGSVYAGTGNISADPLFVDTATGNYNLQAGSPAINAGNNDSIPAGITTDIAGNPRIQKGTVDMGAYESPYIPMAPDANGIVYVTPTGAGNYSGDSWANATNDLQMAMEVGGVKQVWVAGGTYKPIHPADNLNIIDSTNRNDAFVLEKDVKVYGGFAGTETALSQRDLTKTANASILSGDIGNPNGNAYHVVISAGDVGTAELNGFTVTMANAHGQSTVSTTVNGNTIYDDEGAIFNAHSSPEMNNILITGNLAKFGGGIFNEASSPLLTNVVITDNQATALGGGIYNNTGSSPVLTNVTIGGNTAGFYGGGLYNSSSSPAIRNSIIYGNSDGIDNTGTSVPVISYSLVQDSTSTANGNIASTDPLFVDAANGNYRLKAASPVINRGNGAYFSADSLPDLHLITIDIAGNPRIVGGTMDMGAYEYVLSPNANGIIYVAQAGAGNNTGNSWANATSDFQSAINATGVKQVWVAAGTYQPTAGQSFYMKDSVKIYGGFAGTETSFSQRNWVTNVTILKGNNNSVIRNYANVWDSSAVLDGFTITGGNATRGGGMYNETSSPTIRNCIFSGNTTTSSGGGMYNDHSAPIISNCIFSGNKSGFYGGVMYNSFSSPTMSNCTFSGNTAMFDGGIYSDSPSPLIVTNSILYGNGSPEISGSGHFKVTYSLVQGGYSGKGNINANPLFVSSTDLHLQMGSPAINAGNNDSIPAGITTDIAGNLRIQNGIVDMGAYESPYMPISPDANGIVYVTQNGAGNGSGDSWANATNDLQKAIDADSVRQVWVAGGTYQPASGQSFSMKEGVKIYGGFAGTETSFSQRNLKSGHKSILKGSGTNYFFGYTVIVNDHNNLTSSAVLDGFTITNGFGNTNAFVTQGGGMRNIKASPTLSNLVFDNNGLNGGPNPQGEWPVFGGGMFNDSSSVVLENVVFINNSAFAGGGMYNLSSSPTLINVIFVGNTAQIRPSGSAGGSAMYNVDASSPKIINVTFANNESKPYLYGGSKVTTSGVISNYNASVTIENCLFWNNINVPLDSPDVFQSGTGSFTINNSYTQTDQSANGSGNIIGTTDPFVDTSDMVGADSVWGTADDGLELTANSAAINSGNNTYLPDDVSTDIAGNPRFVGGTVDMGAYEYQDDPINYSNIGFADSTTVYNETDQQYKAAHIPDGIATVAYTVRDSNNQVVTEAIALGKYTIEATFKIAGGRVGLDTTVTLIIKKGTITGITFNNSTVTYDGSSHVLAISGALPAGTSVSYSSPKTDVGTYTDTAYLSGGNNYNNDTLTARLTIEKAGSTGFTGVTFNNATVTYDGNTHALAISGTLPAGTSVSCSSPKTEAGIYTDTAYIAGGDNYKNDTLTAQLTIGKATITGITLSDSTVTYNGNSHVLAISGTLPAGASVSYSNPKTDAGTYTDTVYIAGGNNYNNDTLTARLTIGKATITGITFHNSTVTYDGNSHALAISGTLPAGASVSYSSPKTDAGIYTDTAYITGGNNYNNDTLTAQLTIGKATITNVSFKDVTVTYNGNSHSVAVDESTLPNGVTVQGYDNNDQTNAGTYTVTAHLSGGNGYNAKDITATLTINKAPQTITFNAISDKSLETSTDFQLQAAASSGLPVTYSYAYTASAPPATVTPGGFVKLLTSGLVKITASQAGNSNYLPAAEVIQTLQINSSNASIFDIQVGDTTESNPSDSIFYQIDCSNSAESVSVTITAEANAIVTPGHTFVIQTPKPGIYTQQITVTSQDGSTTKDYTITVNKAFSFKDIVVQKFNNVLLVNNNPATNGGYQFVGYKWYKNGVLVGTGPYYSAGNEINDQLDNTAVYFVVLTTANGEVLHTCGGIITLTSLFDVTLSPNPVSPGGIITLTAALPPSELAQMRISIYSSTGNLIKMVRSSDKVTQISMPASMIPGTYIVKCETPDFHKSFKLIVQ